MFSENFKFGPKTMDQLLREDLVVAGERLLEIGNLEDGKKFLQRAGLSEEEIKEEVAEARKEARRQTRANKQKRH